MKKYLFLLIALLLSDLAAMHAQVAISGNGNANNPHSAAALDLNDGNNRGLKLPNVSLNVDSTVFVLDGGTSLNKANAAGMIVYNTNSAVTGGKGVYYWDGVRWWKATPFREMQLSDTYIWVSPAHDTKTIQVVSNVAWTLDSQPANATVSPVSGNAGLTTITITKNYATNTNYGPSTFTLKYASSQETAATITVDALWIWDDELMLGNSPGVNTGEYDVDVEGGSQTFMVVDSSTWLTSAIVLPNGKLELVANQEPAGEWRDGFVKVAHTTDPDYIVELLVEQDINGLPPFMYLTIRFQWGTTSDVDIAVEFRDNVLPGIVSPVPSNPAHWVPFDNNPVYSNSGGSVSRAMGYGLANFVNIDGSRGTVSSTGTISTSGTASGIPVFTGTSANIPQTSLMVYGGDATQGQGETVYINAPIITPPSRKEDNTGWDRYIYIDVRAGWYSNPPSKPGDSITVTVSTYEGGIMVKPANDYGAGGLRNTNFYNVAEGTTSATLTSLSQVIPPVYADTIKVNTQGRGNGSPAFRGGGSTNPSGYPKFCTIRYDRYKRDARIYWETVFPSSPMPSIMEESPPKPKNEMDIEPFLKDEMQAEPPPKELDD